MNNVSVDLEITSLNINQQSTKQFCNYTRSIIHMHKWRISPPEYIYIFICLDLKCQGTPETRNQRFANLIIYGVKGFQPDVDSSVYDSPYIFESEAMVMQTDLDMNNHKILNGPPRSGFLISGYYNRIKKK